MLSCPESIHVDARRCSGLAGESRRVPLHCASHTFTEKAKRDDGCHIHAGCEIHICLSTVSVLLFTSGGSAEDTYLSYCPAVSVGAVSPSDWQVMLLWSGSVSLTDVEAREWAPPPQDPIKAEAGVCRFDIHRPGNLCHQHILCHVRMVTAY